MSLIQLEPQHKFPREDVSDANADMLELLLLHGQTVELSHTAAEKVSYLYQIGHKAIMKAAAPQLDDEPRSQAFSYGITTFEAVAALVRPQPDRYAHNDIGLNFKILVAHNRLAEGFIPTLSEARDTFTEEMPRTKQLVGQSATRFYNSYADYAITGAAIARQLEIDAVS